MDNTIEPDVVSSTSLTTEILMPTMEVTMEPMTTTSPTAIIPEDHMPTMDVTTEPISTESSTIIDISSTIQIETQSPINVDVCTDEESIENEMECLRAYILSLAGDITNLRQRVRETELEVEELSSCCSTDQCSDVYSQIESILGQCT